MHDRRGLAVGEILLSDLLCVSVLFGRAKRCETHDVVDEDIEGSICQPRRFDRKKAMRSAENADRSQVERHLEELRKVSERPYRA